MAMMAAARVDGGECAWVQAHEALSRLARERATADAEEGRWLLRAWRSAAHVHLGHTSFSQYIERLLGYKPRTTQEKLRVAEALEQLPRLARLLETGAISWCAVRELTRVAVAATEQAWIAAALGKTTRELETLVAGKDPGDEPAAPDRPRRQVLRFEVAPETFALFRAALQRLRRAAGGSLDDDAALLSMARHVLAGPADDARASYQVVLNVCATCGRGAQQAGGELVPVGTEVVAMAACDAQHLGRLLPHAANENAGPAHDTPEHSEPEQPNCGRAHVGVAGAETVAVAHADRRAPPSTRAKQTIPPALRRAVLARDQHRCRVPGCTHAIFVDLHHVQPRSEGGRNEPGNLLTLCAAHHRATHRGELVIERSKQGAVRFCHADGTTYGQAVAPRRRRANQGLLCAPPARLSRARSASRARGTAKRAGPSASERRSPAARSTLQDSANAQVTDGRIERLGCVHQKCLVAQPAARALQNGMSTGIALFGPTRRVTDERAEEIEEQMRELSATSVSPAWSLCLWHTPS